MGRLNSHRLAGIWNSPFRRPPDRERVIIGLSLISVGAPELVVVVEGVGNLACCLPTIGWRVRRIGPVVPAVADRRRFIWLRVKAADDDTVRVKVRLQVRDRSLTIAAPG